MNVFKRFENRIMNIDSNKKFTFVVVLVVLVLLTICVGAAILVTNLATK